MQSNQDMMMNGMQGGPMMDQGGTPGGGGGAPAGGGGPGGPGM